MKKVEYTFEQLVEKDRYLYAQKKAFEDGFIFATIFLSTFCAFIFYINKVKDLEVLDWDALRGGIMIFIQLIAFSVLSVKFSHYAREYKEFHDEHFTTPRTEYPPGTMGYQMNKVKDAFADLKKEIVETISSLFRRKKKS